jgi:hypothetical protein
MQMSLICKCLFTINGQFVIILKNLNQNETNHLGLFSCEKYHPLVYLQAL